MSLLNPDQELALAYAPKSRRDAFRALLELDRTLGKALSVASEPGLAAIRLAWWRNQIESLPDGPIAPDSALVAIGEVLRSHDVKPRDLVHLVNGWETLLDDWPPSDEQVLAYAERRGEGLFRAVFDVAGAEFSSDSAKAAKFWALVDFANHASDCVVRDRFLELAAPFAGHSVTMPSTLRPFAILVRFAEHDLKKRTPPGSPRRIWQIWRLLLKLS